MAWTEERVQTLRKLWTEGLSANQIAKQLACGFSRNAVIGKVHRLGLPGRATPPRPTKTVRVTRPRAVPTAPRLRTVAPPRPAKAPIIEVTPKLREDGRLETVQTISSRQCRYPYGDPNEASFGFCGHSCKKDSQWCADHRLLVYQPSETAAERRERQRINQRTETVRINGERVAVALKMEKYLKEAA